MILCITHTQDRYTVDKVMDFFKEKEILALRFNTDLFLDPIQVNYHINSTGEYCLELEGPDFYFSTNQITGVWCRKVWVPKVLNHLPETYQKGARKEANATIKILFEELSSVPWVNNHTTVQKVESNKFIQLKAAQKAGLLVPNTIIGNNPKKVKELFYQSNGALIAKMQTSLAFSMDCDDNYHLFTTRITEDMLDDLDMLEASPMIFQTMIPKLYELRVTYVDGHCFTGKIDSQKTKNGQVDWKKSENAKWEEYTLPKAVSNKLTYMMNELNLSFGAIDLICKPNGEYVFLEVNPAGEWGMLQKLLNYPIAEKIGETLLKKIAVNEK